MKGREKEKKTKIKIYKETNVFKFLLNLTAVCLRCYEVFCCSNTTSTGHRGRQDLVHRPRACGQVRERKEKKKKDVAELQTDRNDAVITVMLLSELWDRNIFFFSVGRRKNI